MPYSLLNRAKLSVTFLESNAATHHFLFGALAEFLDNSRDANATTCKIFTEKRDDLRGGYMLCFLDDGEGMDPLTAKNLLTFGYSEKRNLDNFIGEYGNGLKSGSMRLGKDFILFTKIHSVCTIVFISRTFFQDEHLENEIIVPTPSININSRQPWFDDKNYKDIDLQKFQEEMDLIYKYSPFKNRDELFEKINLIKGSTGTLLIIYNVHVSGDNKPDLDITTDPTDLLISSSVHDNDLEPEKKSFRAYTSILYSDPKMKIYIQGTKVRTQRLQYNLYEPRVYQYNAAKIFKEKTEKDIKQAEKTLDLMKERKRDAESDASFARENAAAGPLVNTDGRRNARLKQVDLVSLNSQIQQMQKEVERMKKNKNSPKIIELIFGLNVRNRSQDGYFIYNGHRLIRMHEKTKKFLTNKEAPGVLAMVDIPFSVLKPGNNKQSFDDENTQKNLLSVFDEHLAQYIRDALTELQKDDLRQFWSQMGYDEHDNIPNQEYEFKRLRFFKSPIVLQCDSCLKWRSLRLETNLIDKQISETWTCSDNAAINTSSKSCDAAEKLGEKLKEGVLIKEQKKNEEEQREVPKKNNNNLSSARSSLTSNSSNYKPTITNKVQIDERQRVSMRPPSTTSDSEASVQRASTSSILQRPNQAASTSASSIQISASILNSNQTTRTSNLSSDAERIVSRALSEVDDEEERRRNSKRHSEDVFTANDDYMTNDTNDDFINQTSDTLRINKVHHKKKKKKRFANILGLDSSSDNDDDDREYRPPSNVINDVNNNRKNADKTNKSTNSNSRSNHIISSIRPVIKTEPEIVNEQAMDYQPNESTANTSINGNDELRNALQRNSVLEKKIAELEAKCKEYERNSDSKDRKIFELHKSSDDFKSKKESAEKKIKELERENKEFRNIKEAYSKKIDEYKELELKIGNFETTNDILAENLKVLLENLRDPNDSTNKYTELPIASLIKVPVQDVFNQYRDRVEDQFQVQLDVKCNEFYKETKRELNQKLFETRARCTCGSFKMGQINEADRE